MTEPDEGSPALTEQVEALLFDADLIVRWFGRRRGTRYRPIAAGIWDLWSAHRR